MQQISRLKTAAAELVHSFGHARRRSHRREVDVKQFVFFDAVPRPAPGADGDVGFARAQIHQLVAGRQPHGKVGMLHLKCPEDPREPGVGEGVRSRDRQQRFVFFTVTGERSLNGVESARQGRE